jgi:hypothetical protein
MPVPKKTLQSPEAPQMATKREHQSGGDAQQRASGERWEARNAMKWDPRKLDSEWPFDVMSTDFELHAESTALIVVDMQGTR